MLSIVERSCRSTAPVSARISVVIPAHNEEILIARCIESVLAAGIPADQIYVVDALDWEIARAAVGDETVPAARLAAGRLATMPPAIIDQAVRTVLSQCGTHCADVTPAIVEGDDMLRQKALVVSALDQEAKHRNVAHVARPRVVADASRRE